MNMFIVDGRQMTDRKTAHIYLKDLFKLPEHYGNNLDALYDCLCEIKGQIIVTYVAEMQDNLRREANGFINTFEAAAEKNPRLYVIVEEVVDEI